MSAANLLASFCILFESDAEDVDRGAQEAGKSTDQLERKLKDVDRSAARAGDSFASLASRAAKVLLPLVGLAAIKSSIVDFAANADAAGQLAKTLQMDVEQLQAWQGAASRAGGTVEGFSSSVKNLNDKLYEFKRFGGGEAGMVFYHLGIRARDAQGQMKGTDAILLDLADKLEGMDRTRAVKIAEKLGLDEGTVDLLQKGRKGVEELLARQKELGVYSKKDAEDARKFKNAWADVGQAFSSVAAVVLRQLLPVFTGIGDGVTRVAVSIRKHEDLVTGFLVGLGVLLGILAIKSALAFAPFLLFVAAILLVAGAFAVLYDDVMNFLEGHDSVIGRLSKDYPWIADLVHDVVDALTFLWNIAKAVGELLVESVENPGRAWENFMAKVSPLIDGFTEKFPLLGQAIQDVGTIIQWLFDLAWPLLKGLGKLVKDILGGILSALSKIGGWIAKALRWVAGKIKGEAELDIHEPDADPDDSPEDEPAPPEAAGPPPVAGTLPPHLAEDVARGRQAVRQTDIPLAAHPAGMAARQGQIARTTTVTVNTVEVHTQATDAKGISQDISGALERELQSAVDNFDDGRAA